MKKRYKKRKPRFSKRFMSYKTRFTKRASKYNKRQVIKYRRVLGCRLDKRYAYKGF